MYKMNEKRFELRLCPNGTYYVWENGELVIDHISFDKWHKEDANDLIDLLNELSEENEHLLQSNRTLGDNLKQEEEENANEYNALLKENEQLRHELDSLTGCYCADNKEFKDYWRIGYDD